MLYCMLYFQSVLSTPYTDTEKHVEILQAENNRLLQELTDSRNAHTKALTVSKLTGHRQQVRVFTLYSINTHLDASTTDSF